MDWNEVVQMIEARVPVVARGAGWLGLLFSTDDASTSGGVRMKVLHARALEIDVVEVVAEVCVAGELDAMLAVHINQKLPVGSLTVESGRYLLRQTLPLAGLEPATLLRIMAFAGREVEHLRSCVTRWRGQRAPLAVEHFAE